MYICIYIPLNLFVCMLSFHYVTICLSYFLLSHSIYLSVYFSPSPLFSQLTPHPFDPNPFNDSTPPSPLKSVRKARASLCFFFVVQSVGLLDTSVGKIVTCERINRHYLHSCRFFANFSVVSRLTLILYLKVPIRLMQTNYHLLLQQIARTQSVAWNNSLGEFSLSTHKKNLFITKTSR